MKVVYFASVRESIGVGQETLELPPDVGTVAGLVAWLKSRGEGYATAFASGAAIRAAVDHVHVRPDASIAGAREIAFFPPMTGG